MGVSLDHQLNGKTQTFITRRYRISVTHSIAADFVDSSKSGIHGHDMYLEITFQLTKIVVTSSAIQTIDRIVNETVIAPLDGKHLNDIVEPATGERLGQYVLERLQQTDIGSQIQRVLVVETRKNRFIIEQLQGA